MCFVAKINTKSKNNKPNPKIPTSQNSGNIDHLY